MACDLSEKPHYLAGSESDAHLMARWWLLAKSETQRPLPSGEVGVGSCVLWRSLEERNIRRGSEETLFHPAVPPQGCVCHDLRSWSSLFLAGVNSSSLPLGMT